MKKVIYYLLIIGSLCSNLQAQNCNDAVHAGEGTYYNGVAGSTSGNCSLPVDAGDTLHCALNTLDYDNSNACGASIKVSGPKGSVVLKVVDRCPECAEGDVDMTEEAFEQIADVIDGRVDIEWEFVSSSEIESPGTIKVNFKSGSSEFWTAIQFRDIEHAISDMEYKDTNGSWIAVNRELFNFFIEPNGIPSPMDLRVTSILGEILIFEQIVLDLNNDFDTNLQFSTPQECTGPVLSFDTITSVNSTFKMYPNPSLGFVTFTNSSYTNIDNKELSVVFTNTLGQTIDFKVAMHNGTLQIETSKILSGLYLIKVSNGTDELYVDKLVVK